MISKCSRFGWCLLFSFFCACSSPAPLVSAGPLASEVIQVFFSPNGGATEAVVRELGNAKMEILVQAYSFTSRQIAKALVNAQKRGVKVIVILDRSQRSDKYNSADFVHNAGIPVGRISDDGRDILSDKLIRSVN